MDKAKLFISSNNLLGESPTWDSINQKLYWIDIIKKEIHSYLYLNGIQESFQMDQMIGCLALTKQNSLIVALQDGIYHFDPNSEDLQLLAVPKDLNNEIRFNDGKCDPYGNFLAGTMALDEKRFIGTLYLFTEKKIYPLLREIGISNGIAFSLDGRILYFNDSLKEFMAGGKSRNK